MQQLDALAQPGPYDGLMTSRRAEASWPDQQTLSPPSREELLDPRTQIVADRDAYLGQGRHDVGRRISDDQVELFITADVAGSLQREFVLHTPEFITLHDVGMSASLRLLTSLAGAAGARVQRLSIRRQGHGVALAVLQFVEMPLADGTPVRVYSTDINADSLTRFHVARVLLAYSRLGVLLVGEMTPNALAGQIQPLHEALLRGPWVNRDMLMVPLAHSGALAGQASQLSGSSAVTVTVTPRAEKPRQAWAYIGGAWNRMHTHPGTDRILPTDMSLAVPKARVPLSEAATQPMPLEPEAKAAPAGIPKLEVAPPPQPAPRAPQNFANAPTQPTPMPKPGGTSWKAYAERCGVIKGCMAACVFDQHSLQVLAAVGNAPPPDRMAQQGALLLAQFNETSRSLGLGPARAEAAVSTGSHHLLVRPVPGHPGIAVHLVLQASASNLTLARMQLERVEAPQ